jgi:hypothetical protein
MKKRQGEIKYLVVFSIILLMSFIPSCAGGRGGSTGTVNVSHLAELSEGWGNADGTGAAARFYNPSGMTTDGTSLYAADYGNGTIRKIVITTGAVTTLAGTAGTIGHADGRGVAATFNSPSGITTDGTNLYVADSGNNTIRKIVIATGAVTTLAGTARVAGHADSTGVAACLYNP